MTAGLKIGGQASFPGGAASIAQEPAPWIAITPFIETGRNWTRWIGPVVSILILAVAVYQLRTIDFYGLFGMLPSGPTFWLIFGLSYLASPLSEWIIFHRLWSLPIDGFPPLVRKLVSNEILLGYLGEVYFYAWARQNARIKAAPFGAIKDVTILSAVVGNLFTLLLVVGAIPLFGVLHLGLSNRAFAASTIFLLLSSLAILALRKRLFSLPRAQLWFVVGVHSARVIATTVLAATMWHLVLPAVALSWWLLLATLRQLLSRLPLLPNKDLVFAGIAAFLIGPAQQITAAMTLMATLILAGHLAVGGVLGMSELFNREDRA
jgi:hypothetical protein